MKHEKSFYVDGKILPGRYFQEAAELAEKILEVISKELEDREKIKEIKKITLFFIKERGGEIEIMGEPTYASTVIETMEKIASGDAKILERLKDTAELAVYTRDVAISGKFGSQLKTPELFEKLEKMSPGITRPLLRPGD